MGKINGSVKILWLFVIDKFGIIKIYRKVYCFLRIGSLTTGVIWVIIITIFES